MKCPKCQSENPDGVKFCHECGSRISGISKPSEAEAGDPGSVVLSSHVTRVARQEVAGAGQVVGERYELIEAIGRGGFGVVWRARDRKLDRTVALKRLHGQSGGEEAARVVERFQREARIIATMNHRNVVQVFDHDRDGEGHYLVMELVEGGSLKEHLKERGKLPLAEALGLVRGIGQGLMHGHRKNLVHRDLKPANVLLQREGGEVVPKIVDFGLARAGEGSEHSISGYGMGTPFYMPPEQRRNAKGVNHTADIYALGKVFYEMLTGSVPDQVDPEKVPEGVARVIFRCVKERPEERYFSVEELLQDVEVLGGGAAVAGRRGSGGGVPCPQCQASNAEDAKFCEACGAGMTRVCPECERENSVYTKFCRGCGTEVEALLALRDIRQRMEQYREGKKWSRVIKEAGLAPSGGKLPGKKGQETLGALKAMREEAEGKLKERDALRAKLDEAIKAEKWDTALEVVGALEALGPESGDYAEVKPELERRVDEVEREAAAREAKARVEKLDPHGAARAWEAYLKRQGKGAHRQEAERELERLRKAMAEAESLVQQAASLGKEDRLEEALEACRAAMRLDAFVKGAARHLGELEERLAAWNRLKAEAMALMGQREFPAAKGKWQEAGKLRPGNAEARAGAEAARQALLEVQLAQATEMEGQPREAVEFLERLAAESPVDARVEAQLERMQKVVAGLTQLAGEAQRLRQAGRWRKCLGICREILARDSDHPVALEAQRQVKAALRRRRHKWIAAGALAALLALAAVATTLWQASERQRRQVREEAAQRERAAREQAAQKERAAREEALRRERATQREALEKRFPGAFVNTLGMVFVPSGAPAVLFGVWEIRVSDYNSFAQATKRAWTRPSFRQGEDHPAVNVSWDDAKAFCAWLTEKERREGTLKEGQEYRLPTDAEWSFAVGLENEGNGSPKEKDGRIKDVYPWGTEWPPPRGAGNYDPSLKVDDFANTSPVGSFAANRCGLHDMGGNVWEWCEDFYERSSGSRVLRGGSWLNDHPVGLASACRSSGPPETRYGDFGFRCVLAVGGSSR